MQRRAHALGFGNVWVGSAGCLILLVGLAFGQSVDTDAPAPVEPAGDTQPAEAGDTPPTAATEILHAEIGKVGFEPIEVLRHTLDPAQAHAQYEHDLEAGGTMAGEDQTRLERILQHVDAIRRPRQVTLSLEDALRSALANNYGLHVDRYNPAIETTRVVEAESVFDAVFFGGVNKNLTDQPTGSQLAASTTETVSGQIGIRKTLPVGTQVQLTQETRRFWTSLVYQEVNPEWTYDTVLQINQPLLRNFGIDANRAQIVVSKHNRQISDLAFQRSVRDLLFDVEQAYWQLLQARRNVVITGGLLADFEAIYEQLEARKDFDVTEVQLAATRARLERSKASFVEVAANVRDAEDRLIALMNDPDLNLADGVEIIPLEDLPTLEPVVFDRLAEIQTALENRAEIREQQLRVASAKVAAGQAKNAELPRLDLTFRTTANGLGENDDQAFDQMSTLAYIDYYIGIELEVPIGNRGPRAARRRAVLQHAQAAAALRQQTEAVILDVNLKLRQLTTAYQQIAPSFESAQASAEEVRSIVARAERKDINTLTTELNARESLASSRQNVINALLNANLALIDLERSKGTLLRYHNVSIEPTHCSSCD